MRTHWPVVIDSGDVILRPLRLRDQRQWKKVRAKNRQWLEPWEATLPKVPGDVALNEPPSYLEMIRSYNKEGRSIRSISLGVWYQGALVGQISMGGIIMGALRGAHIGYWIDQSYANLGITTVAVEAMTHFGFKELSLHRIEINIRPENAASIRVAEKSGYHFEGERPRFLHIDGQWRDHHCYVRENSQIS